MSIKTGLGKGLDALLPKEYNEDLLTNNEQVNKIKIDLIEPNADQPRKLFDESSLIELAQSIKSYGIVQPLVVTKTGSKYKIIAGERRWRAAKLAKLEEVPAIVRSLQEIEELEVAIIENVQRVDLSPLEQAKSIERLHDQFSLSYSQIADKLGKAVPTINNIVRLLQLSDEATDALNNKQITEGHARSILALKHDPTSQQELLDSIIKYGWSVRQAEQFVTANKNKSNKSSETIKIHMSTENDQTKLLAKTLNTKISIKRTAKGGRLEVHFTDEDDLRRITDTLLT